MAEHSWSRQGRMVWLGVGLLAASQLWAQPALSAADYARAENQLDYRAEPRVDHAVMSVHWLDKQRFWYLDHDAGGDHYWRMDAASGQRQPLLDAAIQRQLLSPGTSGEPAPRLRSYQEAQVNGKVAIVTTLGAYHCQADGGACREDTLRSEREVLSPNGQLAAFIRDWNLWLRDTATGHETQLTFDGRPDDGYATDNAGWRRSNRPILVWSPDSKKIATFQQDQRRVGSMYLVDTRVGHPRLDAWKYSLPGDKEIPMLRRVVIDVASRRVQALQLPPEPHRSSLCDDISCGPDGGWDDVKWAPDSHSLAFVSTARNHRQEWFRLADPDTGAVRTVFSETVPAWFESGYEKVNWQYLPQSAEVIWFSQRDGWGQLYLYDLKSGRLKSQITHGTGNVTQVLQVDPRQRLIWFRVVGKQQGWDPYWQAYYRIGFDGRGLRLLTPEPLDHQISPSPDGQYFVDAGSTPSSAPVTRLRHDDGRLVTVVARADLSRLKAAGWMPPQPIRVRARDGKTELYGLMFKPRHFDPSKCYPLVDYVYPGPQVGSVRGRSFRAARGDNQALAELGFIVIAIDGMGTPLRSKAFHTAYFQHIEDDTLPDQVAAIDQLASHYSWIDRRRVGIWGHSGGGNAAAVAMLRYPELFKVGIAESGNHDNRVYEDDWAEKWQGLLQRKADGSSNYDAQANQALASHLKGHLLLAYGTLDDNVPPNNSLLLVDALIRANKDFDLVAIPNARHAYGAASLYMLRRRWDYFVRYLQGASPPPPYHFSPPPTRELKDALNNPARDGSNLEK